MIRLGAKQFREFDFTSWHGWFFIGGQKKSHYKVENDNLPICRLSSEIRDLDRHESIILLEGQEKGRKQRCLTCTDRLETFVRTGLVISDRNFPSEERVRGINSIPKHYRQKPKPRMEKRDEWVLKKCVDCGQQCAFLTENGKKHKKDHIHIGCMVA